MKKSHLIAGAIMATGLIFSAASQAGGLVGGFGGGVGGALGGGFGGGLGSNMGAMGNLAGSMNGAGAFDASSNRLGQLNHSADRGAHAAGDRTGKAASAAKGNASNDATATQGALGNVTGAAQGGLSNAVAASKGDAGNSAALATSGTNTTTLTDVTKGEATKDEGGKAVSNNAGTNKSSPSPREGANNTPRLTPTTQGSESFGGALSASKSGADAGAFNQSAVSHGDSGASQNAAAGASVTR